MVARSNNLSNLPNLTSRLVDVITCLVLLSNITGGIRTNSHTSAFTLLLKPATIWQASFENKKKFRNDKNSLQIVYLHRPVSNSCTFSIVNV